MNEIQVLQKTALLGKELTVYGNVENPLFLAKEVAEWIGYDLNKVGQMIQVVDEDEKLTTTMYRSGQNREVWMLTEEGLYEILMQSRKPIAKQFKKGVKRILKELRTKGGYIIANENEAAESIMAKAVLIAQETIKRQNEKLHILEEQNKSNAPKVLFADAVSTSQRSCLVAELAKILQQNGVNIGQNRLFSWMRENGYLCQKGQYHNQPTQKAMELGLFEIKQTTITKPDGTVLVTTTTKVTGKGQIYFVDRILQKRSA